MEATIVCVDNSEWTRNGDFSPDRFQAQADAVNLLAGSKMQDNPENGVGVLTMAGKSPKVLVTPTSDLSKVLNCVAALTIDGEFSNICTSVQVAQLALKHRSNKNQRQRIVLFSGSPVTEDKDMLLKIAKKLKKNNVAIDVVCFGSGEDSVEKLQAFMNAVQNCDNSHFIDVQQGVNLSDALIGTPIFRGENAGGFAAGPSMAVDGEFNVDPNIDPELALALRISMEEERERQSRAAAATAERVAMAAEETAQDEGNKTTEVLPEDADETLVQAIAMSMQDTAAMETDTGEGEPGQKLGDAIEDAELQAALRMSLEAQHGSSDSIIDPAFVNSVLSTLPGVDPTNPDLQQVIQNLTASQSASSSKKEEEESKQKDEEPKNDDQPPPASSG